MQTEISSVLWLDLSNRTWRLDLHLEALLEQFVVCLCLGRTPGLQVLLALHARHGVVHGVAGHDAVDLDHGITLRGQIHTYPGRQLVNRRVQGAIDNSTRLVLQSVT